MSCDYEVDRGRRLVKAVLSGDVSMRERLESVERIVGDESLVEAHDLLVDASGELSAPSVEDVEMLSKMVVALHMKLRGRIAIVSGNPAHAEIARLVSMRTDVEDRQVRVYPDAEQAMAWLSCTASEFPARSAGPVAGGFFAFAFRRFRGSFRPPAG